MNKLTFGELSLSKELNKAIDELGYEIATPIQTAAIPVMLEGKDIIGQAQTGTGKTAAFGIPAIEMIDISIKSVQKIILCPTRELALQVAEEMGKLAKYKKDFHSLPVYGGQPIDRQLKALKKGVQVVIGTPGRVVDHINRGSLDLTHVDLVVLDEADEMLDMGFRDDLEFILKQTPKKRQTVMFSATMPKPILELTKKYLRSPSTIKVSHEVLTVPGIEQSYFEVKEKNKAEVLSRVIDLYNIKLALVFCNTKRGTDQLVEQLNSRGYLVDGLHGDMRQNVREKVLNNFRKGNIEILVATDVAARGLDVDDIEAVFNYDMPQDEEAYVHRIGRTARAGKTGRAFTFVTSGDILKLRTIQKYIKSKLKLNPIPSYDDVEEMRTNQFLESVKEVINKGKLDKYVRMVELLINDDLNTLDIAAALIKMNLKEDEKKSSSIDEKRDEHFSTAGQVRLFFSVGKKDKIRPGDILGAIAGETGLSGNIVGEIAMYDKYTFVNVPGEHADEIIEAVSNSNIKGKSVSIEVANKKNGKK